MNNPSDRELLDLLGVEIENKGESSIKTQDEKIISAFEEINNFFKTTNRFPENKISRNIFERIYSVRLNILRKNKDYKDLLMSFDKYKLLEISDNESEIINKTEPTNLELLTSLGAEKNTSDITQLKYVRPYEERQIEEMFANREKCIEFEKYKSLFEKIQIEIKEKAREN